jgi:hypothetical protein
MAVAIYQPRNPQSTPLYFLVESLYEKVKAVWEERFERSNGFWRGFIDDVVARYLDCGVLESGFARVFCDHCKDEFLLPFSCKVRGLCPSCGAKRAAAFAAFLKDELLEDVCHAQWVFTIPKMLRPYFLYHRELLGQLCRAAYETVKELMIAATEDKDIRPGMVAVIQTFSQFLLWNPHIHALASRGGWNAQGQWVPVPFIDPHAAELLFRHKIFQLLKTQGLISDERIELLLSWRHTGFSIDNSVTVYPSDEQGLERLARYMIRSPVSLQKLHYLPQTQQVFYQTNKGHDQEDSEIIDSMEFVARVLMHVPDLNKPYIHHYGIYSNRSQHKPRKDSTSAEATQNEDPPRVSNSKLRRRWADLIRRVYQTDPLICPKCGSKMRILSFITQPRVINKILEHLKNRATQKRAPPTPKLQQAPLPLSP